MDWRAMAAKVRTHKQDYHDHAHIVRCTIVCATDMRMFVRFVPDLRTEHPRSWQTVQMSFANCLLSNLKIFFVCVVTDK
jgi:hypothetical protein